LVRPEFLLTAPDTTTPPDDMLTQKAQPAMPPHALVRTAPKGPSLLERRGNNPHLARGILLPGAQARLGDDLAASPAPTHTALSPLPAANRLYAGHTPLIPGSPSPINDDLVVAQELLVTDDDRPVPDQDLALTGPLSLPTLPTNPVDGAAEHIVLSDLDRALEQVAREQERFARLKSGPEPAPPRKAAPDPASHPTREESESQSRKGSADSRSSTVSFVNGVPLKSPPLNFGVPMGQLPGKN